jgi:hypothetical protein
MDTSSAAGAPASVENFLSYSVGPTRQTVDHEVARRTAPDLVCGILANWSLLLLIIRTRSYARAVLRRCCLAKVPFPFVGPVCSLPPIRLCNLRIWALHGVECDYRLYSHCLKRMCAVYRPPGNGSWIDYLAFVSVHSSHVELITWRPSGRQPPPKNTIFERHSPKQWIFLQPRMPWRPNK